MVHTISFNAVRSKLRPYRNDQLSQKNKSLDQISFISGYFRSRRSVRLIKIINQCCTLKNQGGDTFWKNNIVTFETTLLIRQAIRIQDFCFNISEKGNIQSNATFCDN